MQSIQALRERRNAVAKEVKALLDDNKDKQWEASHQTDYDTKMSEIDNLDKEIKNIQGYLDTIAADNIDNKQIENFADKNKDKTVRALHEKWLRGGDNAISAEEWQVIRNTMSTGAGSEGGYTVQKEIAQSVSEALKAYGGMRSVATVISTENGVELSYPTSDGTSEEGEQIGENQTATDQDVAFGTLPLNTYKYSSKVIPVPIELLQDSNINMETFINTRLVNRIGRITNKKFTVGTGTSEPKGIVTAAVSGKVGATGKTVTVDVDDLIDLEHSVDYAYRESGNVGFMMHDKTFAIIKKLKDSTGRPIFIPGYDGLAGPVAQTIMGYTVTINNSMAQMAANAKSILFGDFTHYIVRDAMAMTMYRFNDSAYAKLGQVGFMMFSRHGGTFTDVGGAVKYYQNSAT